LGHSERSFSGFRTFAQEKIPSQASSPRPTKGPRPSARFALYAPYDDCWLKEGSKPKFWLSRPRQAPTLPW